MKPVLVPTVDAIFPVGYDRSGLADFSPSLTNQSDKEAADINVILRNYIRSGVPPVPAREPLYIDLTKYPDLHSAVNLQGSAMSTYYQLDPSIRDNFKTAADFVNFALDPRNEDSLVEMGLAVLKAPEPAGGTPPDGAPVAQVNPPVAPPSALSTPPKGA